THWTRALGSPRRWPTPCPSARIAPPMKPSIPRTYSGYSLARRRFFPTLFGANLGRPPRRAARRRGAAGGESVPDRVFVATAGGRRQELGRGLSARTARAWIRRGPERRHRAAPCSGAL